MTTGILAENAFPPEQTVDCLGELTYGERLWRCHIRKPGHGRLNLQQGMAQSCDIYYWVVGRDYLGVDRIVSYSRDYGFGDPTGIDLPGEIAGFIPTPQWKDRRIHERWLGGDTMNMSIGQGYTQVTPLQMAVVYAALANTDGGVMRLVRPHLLIPSASPPETTEEEDLASEAMDLDRPVSETLVDREALALVRQGMWEVVQGKPETGEIGTGHQASFPLPGGGFLMEIGGKTGTAEWSRNVGGNALKQISHVWFAAFAPFDRPEVVAVVLLPEAGGGGGGTCAPIVKDLFRMWFNLPERLDGAVNDGEALG
jgi:penicillin-binding protein 2